MTPLELTGQIRTHLVDATDAGGALHARAAPAFIQLRRAAGAAGFDLVPVSGFRDFERQLDIWNGKFKGERPLFDRRGHLLAALELSPAERVEAILGWSALPGASRHHWGTDLDLIDRKAVPAGYRVMLTAEEYADGGPFGRLVRWLEREAPRFGFFRPFRGIRSGAAAEPWHYSFAPVAEAARRALTPAVLATALAGAPLEGRDEVLPRLKELHRRYVARIDWP